MDMTCSDVGQRMKEWEENPLLDDSHIRTSEILAHLEICNSCRKRYGMTETLVSRSLNFTSSGQVSSYLAAKVMDRIHSEQSIPLKHQRTPWAVNPWLAAAVLVLVFTSGYLFRETLQPQSMEYVEFHFSFDAPNAESVVLVGSLPGTQSNGLPMARSPGGSWNLTVKLKKNEVYTYNFLVDGVEIFTDPTAEEVVYDGFGGENALIRL